MKLRPLVVSALFFSLWLYIGFNLSLANSPTFDEPVHSKAGTLYQQGDFSFDPIEPPLIRRTVTILAMGSLSQRNIVTIITGLLATLLVYYLASRSVFAGWLASFLFLSEPNLLAHSSLFTTDAVSSFLTVITSLLIVKEFWKKPWQLFLLILALSLSAASKVSTLSLLAPLLLFKLPKLGIHRLLILLIYSSLIIWGTYDFRLDFPFRQFPFPIPLGGYLRAIKENILFAQRGQPIFFKEKLFITGPFYKQALVFLLKTPLLHLALFILTRRYLLPVSLIFIVNTFVGLHFGIRHLLTASILLILSAAQIKIKKLSLKILMLLLILIQSLSVFSFLPQLLTYANPLAGNRPYRIFTDSDYDWGQGLIALRKSLAEQGITDYQLGFFGNINPVRYLGTFHRLADSSPLSSLPVEDYNPHLPTIISVTCYYQCGYYHDQRFPISNARPIAQSFLLFGSK